ncbi:MAG: mandelate racemase/muconate lactonizing enzyme family protein [Streptosporangiales bacterium]|nr:mandelate racemase/muconate lactonizing enzyme family protein [Streptosporangiales bacterium]
MKIVDVELIQLAKDHPRPHRNAKEARSRRVVSLVRIATDEGIDGLGEAWCAPAVAEALVVGRLRPGLLGKDPFNVEGIWRDAFDGSAMYDPKGTLVAGLSGVDMACWDIMGKATGLPVCKLLGGLNRTEIPAYASDLHWEEDASAMARAAAGFAEQGYRTVKTHVGVDPVDDVRRVRALREAIGPDVGLMVDINTGFDRPTAIRFGRRIAEYDITWYEEPLSPMDTDGLAVVRAATGLPIATGENEYTRWGFRELLEKGGTDVVMPDVARAGGLTELKKICAVAEAYGVVVSPHNYSSGVCSAATLHLMAAVPGTTPLEWDTVDSSIGPELFVEPPVVKDGTVSVPEGPGLGVHLTDEVRARYAMN